MALIVMSYIHYVSFIMFLKVSVSFCSEIYCSLSAMTSVTDWIVYTCTADTILFIYLYHIFNDNAIITACTVLNNGIV